MKEMIEFIESSGFVITNRWINKNTAGMILTEREVIVINLPLFVASTFIHEFYHDKYPNLSEKQIEKKENNKIKHLTVEQIHKLSKLIVTAIIGGKDDAEERLGRD